MVKLMVVVFKNKATEKRSRKKKLKRHSNCSDNKLFDTTFQVHAKKTCSLVIEVNVTICVPNRFLNGLIQRKNIQWYPTVHFH